MLQVSWEIVRMQVTVGITFQFDRILWEPPEISVNVSTVLERFH